jgi:hypothetical protein
MIYFNNLSELKCLERALICYKQKKIEGLNKTEETEANLFDSNEQQQYKTATSETHKNKKLKK